MGNVINLNQYKKRKAREAKQAQAAQNRVKHGLSQSERALKQKKKQLEDRRLDGHKLDRSEADADD